MAKYKANTKAVTAKVAAELTDLVLNGKVAGLDQICYDKAPVDEAVALLSTVKDRSLTFLELLEVTDTNIHHERSLVLTLDVLYSHWVDLDAVAARSDNVLTMVATNWKERLNALLAEVIVTNGKAVKINESLYSWKDFYLDGVTSEVIAVFNVREDEWSEFAGTFYDGDVSHSGVTAAVVCADGVSRDFRVEGSLGEFMEMMG